MRASTAAAASGIEDFAASKRRVASTKTASSAAARRWMSDFRHSGMVRKDQTSDVHLHIGESRDSGFALDL